MPAASDQYLQSAALVSWAWIAFEQCSKRVILVVLRICPIQSGSLVLVGRVKSQFPPQTSAVKQVHFAKRKTRWKEARP